MTKLPLIFALLLLAPHAAPAQAHEFEAYFKASKQFSELTEASAKRNRMPRASEPAAGELIAILTDSKRFLQTAPFRVEDLTQLTDMCGEANGANMAYLMFELGSHIDEISMEDPENIRAAIQMTMSGNIATFQDEIAQFAPFVHRCMGKQMQVLVAFLKR